MILAYMEQSQSTSTAPTTARLWQSLTGEAGTWTALTSLTDNTSFFDSRIGASLNGVALLGQNGPTSVGDFACGTYTPIAGSADGGLSFTGRDPDCGADWPDIPGFQSAWFIREFLTVSATRIFAICDFPTYNDFGATIISLLKSDDGGATFDAVVPSGINDQFGCVTGLRSSTGRLFLSRQITGSPTSAPMYRSDDDGDTWTAFNTSIVGGGNVVAAVNQIIQMSSGRLVVLGAKNVAGTIRPVTFYSDDDGATWTTVTDPITDTSPFGVNPYQLYSAVAVGDFAVCSVARTSLAAPAGFKPYRLSLDGLTWDIEGTYVTTPTEIGRRVRQITVADDGAVLAAMGLDDPTPGNVTFQIWRGVVDVPGTDVVWTVVHTALTEVDQTACRHTYIANIGAVAAPPVDGETVEWVWEVPDATPECVCVTFVNGNGEELVFGQGHCAECLPQPFSPQLFADSERKSVPVPVQNNLILFWTNNAPRPVDMVMVNGAGEILELVTTALVLSKADASLFGHYLGWHIQGTDAPFRLETVEMEFAPTRLWDATP